MKNGRSKIGRGSVAENNNLTASKDVADIELVRIKAIASRAYGTALKASQLQGLYLGLFKSEVKVEMNADQVREREQRLLDKLHKLAAGAKVRRPRKIKTDEMRRLTQKRISPPEAKDEIIDVEPNKKPKAIFADWPIAGET